MSNADSERQRQRGQLTHALPRSPPNDQQQQQSQPQFAPIQIDHALAVNPHWTVESLLGQGASAAGGPAIAQPSTHILTMYMQDYRSGGDAPDHLLSELPIPLHKDANDQWWVNADEMVRRLQATPGRIDGTAKLSIKRGIYRQLFCRISATSTEKCNPENLRIAPDHSIEIVVEQNTLPTSGGTPTSASPSSSKRQHAAEPEASTPASTSRSTKRQKANGLAQGPNSPGDTSPSVSPVVPNNVAPIFTSHNGLYDGGRPQQQYLTIQTPPVPPGPLTTNRVPSTSTAAQPTTPTTVTSTRKPVLGTGKGVNVKNELARAAIIPWLQSLMLQEEGYEYFVKSKGRILSIADTLRAYRFARAMLLKYNNTQTPPDLENAENRKITKVNIWQALDRQTSWGSDAETTLTLVDKYGPGAPEEHPKIVDMINGKFAPDEREGSVLFLNHLKRIDAESKATKEAAAQAALNAMIAQ